MKIEITKFEGMWPKLAPHLLVPYKAESATDVDLSSGEIRPIADIKYLNQLDNASLLKTLYRYNGEWITWESDIDVVKGPISNDVYDRIYWTGDGPLKGTDTTLWATNAAYIIGLPPASTAPTITVQGTGDGTVVESRTYVYTYVRTWPDGKTDESKPSPASAIVDIEGGQYVTISGFESAPTDRGINKIRIYRSNTGSSGSAIWQFVAEIDVSTTSYDDTVASEDLGEELITEDWDVPPDDLAGLISLPGGFLAGFSGNEVCFSEVNQPHAWPQKYRLVVDYPIVALGHFGNTVVVLTSAYPYMCIGNSPDTMGLERINARQGCLSKRGCKSIGDGVIYPAPDGLMLISPSGSNLITKDILSRDDWQGYNPNTIHACVHNNKYYAWYKQDEVDGEIIGKGFVLDFFEQNARFTELTFYVHASYSDPTTDDLYVICRRDGNNYACSWEGDVTKRTFMWKSGTFFAGYENFSAARVLADYPETTNEEQKKLEQAQRWEEFESLFLDDSGDYDYDPVKRQLWDDFRDTFDTGEELGGALNARAINKTALNGDDYDAIHAPTLPSVYPMHVDNGLGGAINSHAINETAINGDSYIFISYDAYPSVYFKLIVDGEEKFIKAISNDRPFRLPIGYKGRWIQLVVSGFVPVKEVAISTSILELR